MRTILTLSLLALLAVAVLTPAVAPASPDPAGTSGFLPKDALGVTAFQKANPEADGREILVAVLDTGIDLLHPALDDGPDGKAKIVDCHDATDAGLIATTIRGTVENGTVVGLSGRRLTVAAGVTGELRLGLVRASEIFPRRLLRRLRGERKTARETAKRRAEERGEKPAVEPDPGDPVHDLVLRKVEDGWRVVLDSDADGDLAEEPVLREYRVAQEIAVLGETTRLGVGVEVKRDGDAVCLLFDGGGHGTHVAGIIAGWHGDGSPLNGLAPAARLLAVKIGNGRYGGATTHHALIRGLDWAGRRGADVVNISFGGPSLFADGREIAARFIDAAVERYGYAVCISAGNAGPAHTTVGAPATSRRALSIGAWAPADTQTSNYGVLAPRGGSLFAFSSRGPLPTGRAGVDFIAPGAAVSPVPEWSLVAGRNMNGTSMAAPQASGALAVTLSAARREDIEVTPDRLLVALRRSARPAAGLTAVEQGYGLIDAGGAFEALRAMTGRPEPIDWIADGHFDRTLLGDRPREVELSLRPDLGRDPPAEVRSRFQRMVRLESDVSWLTVASPAHASANGATVRARLDPATMTPGLNVGVVRTFDIDSDREVARHVVSAVRPRVVERCDTWIRETVTLRAGDARSMFLRVPEGASRVRVETHETARDGGARIAFRSPEMHVEERAGPDADGDAVPGRTTVHHRPVREGSTLEIVLHRPFRAPAGESRVAVGICFRGLVPGTEQVVIPRGRLGTHVNLRAGGPVRGRFEARVEWSEEPLTIAWTTRRDADDPPLLDEESIHVHEGVAEFDVGASKGEVRVDLGFESPYEDYLDDAVYAIEDANGRVVVKGHFWRGPFSFRPPHRGRFRLRLLVWSHGRRFFRDGAMFSPALLRKIRRTDLAVRHDLHEGFVPGGPSGRTFSFAAGTRASALVLRPDGDAARRGTIRFVDDAWSTPLFEVPLRVEASKVPDLAADARRRLLADLTAALDRDATTDDERAAIQKLAAIVRAAGPLEPRHEADLLRLEAGHGPDAAKAVLPRLDGMLEGLEKKQGPDREAILRARATARLAIEDLEGAEKDVAEIKGDDETVLRLRAILAHRRGESKDALKHLDRLRKTAPPRASLAQLRIELLASTGKLVEARKELRGWTGRFPRRATDVPALAWAIEAAAKAEGEPR